MIFEPRPAIVTGQRSAGRSPRSFSLAVRQAYRRALHCSVSSRTPPSFFSTWCARARSMLSPPSIRWSPTATRLEPRPARRLDDGDQAEVGRAAADVADQDQLAGADLALPALLVRDDPAIEGGLRLLEQGDGFEPRLLGRDQRQLAGRLVERGGDGQDHLLVLEPSRRVVPGELGIPGVADVAKVVGRGLDGRDLPRLGRAAPGQDRRLAVDAGVAEPALGAGDEVARHPRALDPGELADDPVGPLVPGQPRRAGRKVVGARQVEERRQHRPGGRLAGGDQLRDLEEPDVGRGPLPTLRVHIRHRAIGRPQVDSHDISSACHAVPTPRSPNRSNPLHLKRWGHVRQITETRPAPGPRGFHSPLLSESSPDLLVTARGCPGSHFRPLRGSGTRPRTGPSHWPPGSWSSRLAHGSPKLSQNTASGRASGLSVQCFPFRGMTPSCPRRRRAGGPQGARPPVAGAVTPLGRPAERDGHAGASRPLPGGWPLVHGEGGPLRRTPTAPPGRASGRVSIDGPRLKNSRIRQCANIGT